MGSPVVAPGPLRGPVDQRGPVEQHGLADARLTMPQQRRTPSRTRRGNQLVQRPVYRSGRTAASTPASTASTAPMAFLRAIGLMQHHYPGGGVGVRYGGILPMRNG